METSLINLLCSTTPACQVQPGSVLPQGKGTDMSSFFTLLQGSLNEGPETPDQAMAMENLPGTRCLQSEDALTRSLDIIDALAFLPVLLTSQSPETGSNQMPVGPSSYPSDTVEDLLDAIVNALETGNTENLTKTLEQNKGLYELLSGQQTAASRDWLPIQAQASSDSNPEAGSEYAIRDGSGNANSISDAVASLIAALDMTDGKRSATPAEGRFRQRRKTEIRVSR